MKALSRVVVVIAVVAALLGPGVPARAENCDYKTQDGVEYLYCRVVGGCIGAGPVAVDPVVCS
ncbi:MAG: hypothetical protein M3323_00600 [Actinomycetota bacterium]|nr:hypothetical protein [Actinomycetota bacterium]